ncbi:MAG: hypothetical protein ABID45_00390 [Patescibacteria group bacterium]
MPENRNPSILLNQHLTPPIQEGDLEQAQEVKPVHFRNRLSREDFFDHKAKPGLLVLVAKSPNQRAINKKMFFSAIVVERDQKSYLFVDNKNAALASSKCKTLKEFEESIQTTEFQKANSNWDLRPFLTETEIAEIDKHKSPVEKFLDIADHAFNEKEFNTFDELKKVAIDFNATCNATDLTNFTAYDLQIETYSTTIEGADYTIRVTSSNSQNAAMAEFFPAPK